MHYYYNSKKQEGNSKKVNQEDIVSMLSFIAMLLFIHFRMGEYQSKVFMYLLIMFIWRCFSIHLDMEQIIML